MASSVYQPVDAYRNFWLNTPLGWGLLWVAILAVPVPFWLALWYVSSTAFLTVLGLVQGVGVAIVFVSLPTFPPQGARRTNLTKI